MIPKYCVIGIDPSLASTGLAYRDGTLTHVKTEKEDGINRLRPIYDVVYGACNRQLEVTTPLLAIVEDLPRNAMGAGLTGQAQGVVRLALAKSGTNMITIAPSTLKKFATGDGRADKIKLREQYLEDTGKVNKNSDEVDAHYMRQYGVALMQSAAVEDVDDRLYRLRYEYVDADIKKCVAILNGGNVC